MRVFKVKNNDVCTADSKMEFSLLPDTSVARPGNPCFLPEEYLETAEARLCAVYRIDRLGKCIQRRFAPRYLGPVAFGAYVVGTGDESEYNLLNEGFDGAVTVGSWLESPDVKGWSLNGVDMTVAGTRDSVCDAVEQLSEVMMLRAGDLILIPLNHDPFRVKPDDVFDIVRTGEEEAKKQTALNFRIK